MVEAMVKAREAQGLTRSELARQLGVTPEYVSMIERGVRSPGFRLAKRIADAFGTTVDILFFPKPTNKTFDR